MACGIPEHICGRVESAFGIDRTRVFAKNNSVQERAARAALMLLLAKWGFSSIEIASALGRDAGSVRKVLATAYDTYGRELPRARGRWPVPLEVRGAFLKAVEAR